MYCQELINTLDGFANLENDWDGMGSLPVSSVAIKNTKSLLAKLYELKVRIPSLVPSRTGGVILRWATSLTVINIEVGDGHCFNVTNGAMKYKRTTMGKLLDDDVIHLLKANNDSQRFLARNYQEDAATRQQHLANLQDKITSRSDRRYAKNQSPTQP